MAQGNFYVLHIHPREKSFKLYASFTRQKVAVFRRKASVSWRKAKPQPLEENPQPRGETPLRLGRKLQALIRLSLSAGLRKCPWASKRSSGVSSIYLEEGI